MSSQIKLGFICFVLCMLVLLVGLIGWFLSQFRQNSLCHNTVQNKATWNGPPIVPGDLVVLSCGRLAKSRGED